MTHDLTLAGCTPEPLMNYLKALGVFRLVAEQADPQAKLSWRGGIAHLQSTLDRDALIEFFTNRYRPTPIVGPWGGRSGFYPGSSESGAREALNSIVKASGKNSRLEPFSSAILAIREILARHGFTEKVRDEDKLRLMAVCRNELDDSILAWLDCVYVLTDDSRKFPPLLGTGGNEGSGSYVSTFAQIVSSIFVEGPSPGDIGNAIFGEFSAELGGIAVGHFNPGAIGGPNSSQGFSGGGGVNSWDYLLAIEGCLLFAGAASRRYGIDSNGKAAYPFCVEAVAVGYASTSDKEAGESTRAEIWLPIWSQPVLFSELSRLFSEGRAQLGRRQARNAVEFALSLATLGVSRGIESFVRYAFVMRNGLSYFAAPLGRIKVCYRPQARLLEEPALLEWLNKLRTACSDTDKTPARYQAALRQIDRAIIEFANRSESGNDGPYLQDVLVALGKAERTLAGGLKFAHDKFIRPLQRLNPQWLVDAADERYPEFRLAAAIASIEGKRDGVGPFRAFLEPVEFQGSYANWSPGSTSAVWSNRPLAANLAAVFRRRQMEAFRNGLNAVPLKSQRTAPLADVLDFLRGDVDEDKLTALLWALPAVDWSDVEPAFSESRGQQCDVPFEFGLPRLLVEPLPLRPFTDKEGNKYWHRGAASHTTVSDPDVFHLLSSGRPDAVEHSLTRAARRLKSSGLLANGYRNRRQSGTQVSVMSSIPSGRLLAAMLFPLSDHDLEVIANQVLNPPETEE